MKAQKSEGWTNMNRFRHICPGDGMVDMTVLEAVAARCRSSSLLLGTSKILKALFARIRLFFCAYLKLYVISKTHFIAYNSLLFQVLSLLPKTIHELMEFSEEYLLMKQNTSNYQVSLQYP